MSTDQHPFSGDDGLPDGGAPSFEEVTGYSRDGMPTLDHVRDKIEKRAAQAIGAEELAAGMPESIEFAELFVEREKAAKAKLDEIRKSMG